MNQPLISKALLEKLVKEFPCELPLHSSVTLVEVSQLQGQDKVIRYLAHTYLNSMNIQMGVQQFLNELKTTP